jgi:L-ascorbate metabolism protein UlaG (beta-lactamase superfamily)
MDVTWLGGSCVRLQSGAVSVLTDPFDLPPGVGPLSADVVTLSLREARDRLHVTGPYRLVDGPGEYEIKGVPVSGVAARRQGGDLPSDRSFVYSVQLDNVAACHLGRLNRAPNAQEVQEMGSPDVLFVPLGEPDGLSVQQTLALASQLEVKLIVPMLVNAQAADGRASLERLCRELGSDPSVTESRLSVSASGLPASARVVVLTAEEQPHA